MTFEQVLPTLEVADINGGSIGLDPRDLTVAGDLLFFTADDGIHGRELWRTDGTSQGTRMVKDIAEGPRDGIDLNSRTLGAVTAVLNDTFYLVARDYRNTIALWTSDGSPEGTRTIKRLPGWPQEIRKVNDRLFISVSGRLWVSDGSSDGTHELSRYSAPPKYLTQVGDTLFFAAPSLFKSDGTSAGTHPVSDVRAKNLVNVDGTLFFAGGQHARENGIELWKSDGTADGTVEVKNIATGETTGPPSSRSSDPANLINVDGTLYFTSLGRGVLGLWKSNATESGTVFVSSDHGRLFTDGDRLFIAARNGIRLLGTDEPFFDHQVGRILSVGEDLYFSAHHPDFGTELWKSDATRSGTELVADINPGPQQGVTSGRVVFRDAIYFAADDGIHGRELWKTDGTSAGTTLIYDHLKGKNSNPHGLTNVGGTLFFTADDGSTPLIQLWSADRESAALVSSIPEAQKSLDDRNWPGSHSQDLINLIPVDNKLVFTHFFTYTWASGNVQLEYELWGSDGTVEGTQLMQPFYYSFFNEDGPDPGPSVQTVIDGTLYYDHGRYDGVSAANLTSDDFSAPSHFTAVDDKLFFSATDRMNGRELWVTTDEFQTYRLVKTFRDGPDDGLLRPFVSVYPQTTEMVSFHDRLYFTAGVERQRIGSDSEPRVQELWSSDGTNQGTVLVKELIGQHISNLHVVDEKLFFTSIAQERLSGAEVVTPKLWVSDGTSAGTLPLKDLQSPGPEFVEWNDILYFTASVEEGMELWRTDGTVPGTRLVKDVYPGRESSNPSSLTVAGDLLFFAADDGAHGREVWVSNGTSAGTRIYADLFAGSYSSDPSDLASVDDLLYFSAEDGTRGRELWRSDTTPVQPLKGDANGDGRVDFTDFVTLANHFGQSVEHGSQNGDFDGNGIVDFQDFVLLATNFGRELPRNNLAPVFHLDFSSFTDVSESALPLIVGDAVLLAPREGPLLENGLQLDAARWQNESDPTNQILILDDPILDRVTVGAGSIVTWLKPDDGDAWNNILKTICTDQAEPCAAFGPDKGIELHASGPHAGVYGGVQGWRGDFLGSANVFGPSAPTPFGVHPNVTDTETGEWTHIALTWDEMGERTVYVNGDPGPPRIGGFAEGASFGQNDTGNWSIGGDALGVQSDRGNPDQSRRLEGLLADLAIFDLELDALEISEIMRDGVAHAGL